MHYTTKKICYLAALIAVSVVCNIFTVITGVPYFAISFAYIPTFIAGFFLGPISGFVVGFTGDLLGCFISPKGPLIPLILIASGLLGAIPGLLRLISDRVFPKHRDTTAYSYILLGISSLLCLVIVTAGLNTFALWFTYAKHTKTYWAYLAVRIPWQAVVSVINAVIISALLPVLKLITKGVYPEFYPKVALKKSSATGNET